MTWEFAINPSYRLADHFGIMADQNFNIAIIGAGIGGLALAIGLTHHQIPFTIYESALAFSTVGAGVGLGPNALQAMDLIDKRFRDMYMKIATGNLRPEKKHVMMEAMRIEEGLGEGESWWGHGEWGAPYFERTGAHRKDLLDIMTSFIDKNSVRFNRSVVSIEEVQNEVHLTFANGQVAIHVAAIGCDGINGFTRRAVLGARFPELVAPQYTHKYVYRTIVSLETAKEILGELATDAKMYMGRDANLSTYPISGGRQVNVVAFKRDPHPWQHEGNTHVVDREAMLQDFADSKVDSRLLRLLQVRPSIQPKTRPPQENHITHLSQSHHQPSTFLHNLTLTPAHPPNPLGHLRPPHNPHLPHPPPLPPRRRRPRKQSAPSRRRRHGPRRRPDSLHRPQHPLLHRFPAHPQRPFEKQN